MLQSKIIHKNKKSLFPLNGVSYTEQTTAIKNYSQKSKQSPRLELVGSRIVHKIYDESLMEAQSCTNATEFLIMN